VNEDRIKHLEFIQATISRMATNSFVLKGWSVTLAAALIALSARGSNVTFAVIAVFPPITFWILDAYYLRLERQYRALYDDVRLLSDAELLQKVGPFSLSVTTYEDRVDSWGKVFLSDSLMWSHGMIVAAATSVVLILFLGKL
jgi:hypothetical protein